MYLSTSDISEEKFSQAGLWNSLEPGKWLKLEKLPSPFAYNEALLLCQISPSQWITWVPEHGEYILTF